MNCVRERALLDTAKKLCRDNGFPLFQYSSPQGETLADALGLDLKTKRPLGITINSKGGNAFILYDSEISERQQATVILHELGHAFMKDWNIEEHAKVGEVGKNELLADIFSCVMLALYITNAGKEDKARA